MAVLPPSSPPVTSLPPQPTDTPWPTVEWPRAEPDIERSHRLDALLGEAFGPEVAGDPDSEFGLSLALVAIRHGRLVAERYGASAGPDERLISWSMAKSITHALVGIGARDGMIDPFARAAVPEWSAPDDPRRTITVDQLLRMVPGTRFNEDYVDESTSHCIEMLFGDGRSDMAAYTAALPADAAPGTVFNYASGTTVLVCRILADLVGPGQAFEQWMRRVLLDPLGIDAELTFDDAGTWVGSSFLHATARDFAKFGLLYLRDGVWEGERLLPEGWVDHARTQRAIDDEGTGYGGHWWLWPHADGVFFASGYETQRIIVDPASDVVVVRLGKTPTEKRPAVDEWLERVRRSLAS